jgi:hypothetical protein
VPVGRRRNRRRKRLNDVTRWDLARAVVEIAAISTVVLVLVVSGLGYVADRFHGTGLWSHLLPFAGVVLAVGLLCAALLWGWVTIRVRLGSWAAPLPMTIACCAAVLALVFSRGEEFRDSVDDLNALMGGSQEAERLTIAHQVYAAYRRASIPDLRKVLERAQVYEPTVHDAAVAFAVDAEVLMGIAMTESAFYPRDSSDGGRGLFQVTAPPRPAEIAARQALAVEALDPLNQRHNAFVAAATLKEYLTQMQADLFLALLAYNIGPRNGGLVSIMKQYGARDFVTIQPYLQQLPRDYPVRVLSGALAYRLWRSEHRLLRYEDGENAQIIQRVGIPGMDTPAVPSVAAAPPDGASAQPVAEKKAERLTPPVRRARGKR